MTVDAAQSLHGARQIGEAVLVGVDTLVFILAFLVVPYVIVSGTWIWIRRILKSEQP